ncbi:MAG TPA: AbrB/MazE/SpoVT family DNA-binding domain-containing protein [Allosphingosinicella sp.]|jgi:antitoxin VapB
MSRVKEEQEEYRKRFERSGSMPGPKSTDVKTFKAKVFKSGNSLALRLPAELGLTAGMEMELKVEGSDHFSFEPIDRPRRKLNVAAFWGKAKGLKLIAPEDRVFDERRLDWNGDRLNKNG